MAGSRRLSDIEAALAYFYGRTYRAQYALRIGTVVVVAAACLHFRLLDLIWAAAWIGAFLLSEALVWLWWRNVSPALGTLGRRAAKQRQHQMIFFCALSTTTASAPFLLHPEPGSAAAVVSALFAAGVIMLIAAQQSMTRHMFLWTAPFPAAALIRNMMFLSEDTSPLLMAGLAVCFVVNARQLQLSNAAAEAKMVQRQVEAERANDAKREFLATVSHEIRTPLNGVMGMAQAMAADELTPGQAERLEIVRRSGAALEALLDDILDLSKIEAGKLELDLCAFNLAETLTTATEPFLALARGKGLTFRLDIDEVDAVFEGDPNRIRQIVANFASNAVKFTPLGSVVVAARRHPDGIVVEVRDTGIGMSTTAVERLFDRFAQADAGISGRYGGTGLGLAICRQLAGLMGGEVEVQSRPGEGSCFTLSLPLTAAASPALQGPATVSARPASDRALNVLVAEDNLTNQLVIQHLLATIADVTITLVADGAAAVDACQRGPWDLVLMDINMPVLDGVAATVEIRRQEAAEGRIRTPIIALTANAMSHQVAGYLEAGLDAVVAKPLSATALLSAIHQVLTDSEPDAESRRVA